MLFSCSDQESADSNYSSEMTEDSSSTVMKPPNQEGVVASDDYVTNSSDNTEIVNKEAIVEIVWLIAEPYEVEYEGEISVVDELTAVWEERLNTILENKDVNYRVRIEGFPSTKQDLLDKMQKNEKVDLVSISSSFYDSPINVYKSYVDQGLLYPLTDFLATDKGADLKRVVSSTNLALASVDGEVYGLSTFLPSMFSTAYNKAAVDNLGFSASDIQPNLWDNLDLLRELRDNYGKPPITTTFAGNVYTLGLYILQPYEMVALDDSGLFINVFALLVLPIEFSFFFFRALRKICD